MRPDPMKRFSPLSSRRSALVATLAPVFALALASLGTAAMAQVNAREAWARATTSQQRASGAFMVLRSESPARIVAASSTAAGVTELHEMVMRDGVMRMRALPALDLPAGQDVELRPGGLHIMLMDLRAPLNPGSSIPITLTVEDAQGRRTRVEVATEVRAINANAPAHNGHNGH